MVRWQEQDVRQQVMGSVASTSWYFKLNILNLTFSAIGNFFPNNTQGTFAKLKKEKADATKCTSALIINRNVGNY